MVMEPIFSGIVSGKLNGIGTGKFTLNNIGTEIKCLNETLRDSSVAILSVLFRAV